MSGPPFTYKMVVAYDGTDYSGWQVQPNGISVQAVLQGQMKILLRHELAIVGSGRTDAGVHALGQVAHFYSPETLDPHRFPYSLNATLPKDIRVKSIELEHADFHARYSAKSKTYYYHLYLDQVQNPLRRLYSLHVRHRTDKELLKEASRLFVGTHDFTAFANSATEGSAAKNAVRTLYRLDVVEEEGGVRLELEADGFLYKMVRNIVGTLLEVASGKRALSEVEAILASRDRRRAGLAVPPHGLFLAQVDYK